MEKKFVLWKIENKEDAYKDQYGLTHPADLVTEEIIVEVVEQRFVYGEYEDRSKPPTHIGLKARSTDGRFFFQGWESFCDTCMSDPTILWVEADAEYSDFKGKFEDAVKNYNSRLFWLKRKPESRRLPIINALGEYAIPSNIEQCGNIKHYAHYYYKENGPCCSNE